MKLSFRLAAAFVAFVVLGSLALVLWLGFEERRQSREQFATMARTNAGFLRTGAPISSRTAGSLRTVLGVDVFLSGVDGGFLTPVFNSGQADAAAKAMHESGWIVESWGEPSGTYEAIAMPVKDGVSLILIRSKPPVALLGGRTFWVLTVFWLFSLALAWGLARGIVRPLRALAARMPHISEEKDEPIPETARTDEIGQLARAYAETRAQLAAERTAREQAERLATLGKMATGLAHEINNPVAAIKLHAQLLEGDTVSAPESRLGIILAEAAKIESLVSQWMFLARPQPPQVVECDFAEILVESIRTHAPAADYAGVKITNEVAPGCIIRADRRRLSQAIANVLTNAIHAMSAGGGRLGIRSCACQSAGTSDEARPNPAKVSPRSHERSYESDASSREPTLNSQLSTINLQFQDTGPGFTAAALARATELFFSEKEGGMGIGLSVTAEILKAHGGELRLANAPGGGAIVTLVLPVANPQSAIRNPQ